MKYLLLLNRAEDALPEPDTPGLTFPQLAAFFTSAAILASSAAVSFVRA